MHSATQNQNGLTHRSTAVAMRGGWRKLHAILLLSALGACAGSHEKPAATAESEPGYDEQTDYEANPPAERSANDEPLTQPGATDRKAVDRQSKVGDRQAGADTTPRERSDARSDETPILADDTGRNERDRSSAALTPPDQSEAKSDVELSAQIRRAVVADDALSFDAKNVKIIASDGRVTLRGTVDSAAEKSKVEAHARQAAGAGKVENQLEIEH